MVLKNVSDKKRNSEKEDETFGLIMRLREVAGEEKVADSAASSLLPPSSLLRSLVWLNPHHPLRDRSSKSHRCPASGMLLFKTGGFRTYPGPSLLCDPEQATQRLWAWVSHLASLLETSVLSYRCLLGSS